MASAALEAVGRSANHLRLLITDVNLRGMSGPELVQAVRQVSAELPVLYVSGGAAPPAVRPDELVLRPFEFAELSAKGRQLITKTLPGTKMTTGCGLIAESGVHLGEFVRHRRRGC